MRWLFTLLVLANIAFWMWAHWYGPTIDPELYQPRPPVNAQRLRLLSEPGMTVKPRSPTPSTPPQSSVCYRIGPFSAQARARAAGQRLQAPAHTVFTYTLTQERRDQPTVYRIILPGFASHKAAQDKLKEIDRLGIKDYALITTPDKRPVISLGVFSQKPGAERYLQELAGKGIKARMEPMTRSQPGHWLDISPLPRTSLPVLQEVAAAEDGVSVRERPCGAASALTQQ